MSCKDCFHYEVCLPRIAVKNNAVICKCFKDKSKTIELPCKVGDTVYEVGTDLKIHQSKIKNIIYDTNGIAFDERAIHETVFLTKEQAEARLKELQDER